MTFFVYFVLIGCYPPPSPSLCSSPVMRSHNRLSFAFMPYVFYYPLLDLPSFTVPHLAEVMSMLPRASSIGAQSPYMSESQTSQTNHLLLKNPTS